jgi:beta-lactamase class A
MRKRISLGLLVLSILLNIYFLAVKVPSDKSVASVAIQFKALENKYPLLSKRILNDFPNDLLINFLPLRASLREKVKEYNGSFGAYFEYLPTGTSIGINEKNEFDAVSLLKVPVVMAYYHQRERLNQEDQVVTIREDELGREFGNLWKRGAGTQISLDEAAKLAITDSDNTALRVLTDHIQTQDFNDVYEGLDIDLQTGSNGVIITAKSYSSILKALFFSSLLSKSDSELILEYLDETKFNDKLPAGIPSNIKIAHKVGIYNNQMFSDCGIVYVPRRPYVLCMISKSDDETAKIRMRDFSKTIYDYVSSIEK